MAWSNKIARVQRTHPNGEENLYISNQDGKSYRVAEWMNRNGLTASAEIIDNFIYRGRLRLKSFGYGRGGIAHGYFLMDDGCQVQMSAGDLADEIPKMERGVLQGSFTWKKTGSAVNLYRVPETLEQ